MGSRFSTKDNEPDFVFLSTTGIMFFMIILMVAGFLFETKKAIECEKKRGVYSFRIHQCLTGEILK